MLTAIDRTLFVNFNSSRTAMFQFSKFLAICSLTLGAFAALPLTAAPTPSEIELTAPFLLPHNHPAKAGLDEIFQTSEPLLSPDHLKKAGFKNTKPGQGTGMSAATHPKIKGYRIKTYFHTDAIHETPAWLRRIAGANAVAHSIEKHGYQDLMLVPRKWIYQVPATPAIEKDHSLIPKHYILVVEDIKLVEAGGNIYLYKTHLNKEMIKALYTVIKENLLIDSVYPDNVPFASDGRLAFIDTEHFNRTDVPVRFDRLTKYMPKKYKAYWESLVRGEEE